MQPALFEHPKFDAYQLLDSGAGEKLERFGDITLIRPDPQAIWKRRDPRAWSRAALTFVRESDRGGRWERGKAAPSSLERKEPSWTMAFEDAQFFIRPTPFKHVGVFPEQASNWDWVRRQAPTFDGKRPRLLNLFGYTGIASVLAAQNGYDVTHVDASRASLNWLRDNMRASGLERDGIRIILDDALAFVRREGRRGSRYQGILLDPPHYGRGPKGEKWEFEAGIAPLLTACESILAEHSFVVLSTYAIGTSPLAMANLLGDLSGGEVMAGELALPEGAGGARSLPCGFCARWSRNG